jgi:sugar phosphate isomerase/epimerase
MLSRRTFLKQTTTASLGGMVFGKLSIPFLAHAKMPKPGVQLYTFFNVIDNDVKGTLQKIADIGYKNIESAFSRKGGYYGMKPKEFASMLKDMGLVWKSHHVIGAPIKRSANMPPPTSPDGKPISVPTLKNLKDNYQEVVDEAAEGGVPYLVCASTPIATLEEIKSSIVVLNKAAEAAKKAGIQFAYHNHDAEFKPVDGVVPYELILTETSPDLVKMELDIAWTIKGGADPIALFHKHPGRFSLWHLKDLDSERKTILPVGKGTIDYKSIFKGASTAGLKNYFVEHDMPPDALASIQESIINVKKIVHYNKQ